MMQCILSYTSSTFTNTLTPGTCINCACTSAAGPSLFALQQLQLTLQHSRRHYDPTLCHQVPRELMIDETSKLH